MYALEKGALTALRCIYTRFRYKHVGLLVLENKIFTDTDNCEILPM